MPKNLRWRIPIVVVLIAISLLAIYPPANKVIKIEEVKEVEGKVTDRSVIKDSFFGFMYRNPIINETILQKEIDEKGSTVIRKRVEYVARGQIKLGLDLKGGSELLYKINGAEGDYQPGLTNEIISVLEKRIDPQGILEYRLQQQGIRRILIQVPGATKNEIESLKNRITRLGKLEFMIAAPQDSIEYKEAKAGKTVPGYYKHWIKKKKGEEGESQDWVLVRNKSEITGEHLERVFPDRKDIQPVVGFEFDQVGKAKFGRLTERNIGKPLAIILDGVLYSAPVIRDRIPGKGIIEGNFTQDEINDLIAVMRAGSLPADLELEMETTVGPSLGADSIRKGLLAGLIGTVFVAVFMCIYYLGAGAVANFAFVLNIFMVVASLSLLDATLTLPGIAGLVLMIGMAVDANVLIFERIREEKDKNRSIKLAVKNGYERAFTTIIDSNVTTLITAIVLYAVGTGPIKGFAVVLITGLLINMFTAVFVTRIIFEIFLGTGVMKNFSMLQFFKKPKTDVVSYRRFTMIASLVLIIGGVSIFVVRGKNNYDIDFTGGTLIHLKLDKPVPVGMVRNKLADTGYKDAEVQSIWASGDLTKSSEGTTEFGIRIKNLGNDKIAQKITNDLKSVIDQKDFSGIEFDNVSVYRLLLNSPVDESAIQSYLKDADYGHEDIISVYPLGNGKTTRKFEINVSGLTDQTSRIDTLKNITSALSGSLRTTSVEPYFGEIKEELPSVSDATRGTQFGVVFSMDADLKSPVDPLVFQLELNKEGYTDIEVSSREMGRRTEFPRKLLITGPRDVLETIKQIGKPLNVPSILVVDNLSVRIVLKEDLGEDVLRKLLSDSGGLRRSIGEISGIDLQSDSYAISMKPLSASKIQEKIREDIAEVFKQNLYIEKTKVTFDPVEKERLENSDTLFQEAEIVSEVPSHFKNFNPDENSSGVVAEKTTKNTEIMPIIMKMDHPVSLVKIKEVLSQAGYPDILMDGYEEGNEYHSVNLNTNLSEFETLKSNIASAFSIPDPFKRVVSIGSSVAAEMKSRALLALIFSCFAIVIYIWLRFGEFKFGVAAVLCLVHDVLITIGAVAVADHFGNIFGDIKVNLPMIAAFLTLIGYSLNDTIVFFDRIRENLSGKHKIISKDLINASINQNLNRTLLTGLTTLGVVIALYFVGGPAIHGFAFVMIIGVIVGTYSSIFIASPILIDWEYLKKISKIFFLCLTSPFWFPVRLFRKGN
ncbi:MAG: protein translocase subunit SecD [Candidatus Scalindua sp.]|nr:protein translocase subunit SecD [Candidatus Scalindua sp.]